MTTILISTATLNRDGIILDINRNVSVISSLMSSGEQLDRKTINASSEISLQMTGTEFSNLALALSIYKKDRQHLGKSILQDIALYNGKNSNYIKCVSYLLKGISMIPNIFAKNGGKFINDGGKLIQVIYGTYYPNNPENVRLVVISNP